MKNALKMTGTVGGWLGSALSLVAISGRFIGKAHVFGWDASNLLLLGMAILMMACWAKLEAA